MKTKDDIISIVDATVAAYNNSPVWYKEDVKRYMEIYAQLKLSEHPTKEQWISVEDDRMPDHNGAVLVCNINDPEAPICIGVQCADGETDFHLFEANEKTNMVTHWMELPSPPVKKTV